MENKDAVRKLSSLMKLDIDAAKGYDTALDHIKDPAIHSQISKYRDDHLRHVDNLSTLISSLGETPPSRSPDLRGLFLGGATFIQSISGTEGALKGLETGEKMTNDAYSDAVKQDFPPDILNVLLSNYQDEKIHINYVRSALETKSWEKRKAA